MDETTRELLEAMSRALDGKVTTPEGEYPHTPAERGYEVRDAAEAWDEAGRPDLDDPDLGCVHLVIKAGGIRAAVCRVPEMPWGDEGVVHAKVDAVLTHDEFLTTHPEDADDLDAVGLVDKTTG